MTVSAHSRVDEDNPWPGLNAFDEAAHPFFNGRRAETSELRRMVEYAPVTVVFGRSGLGKTSLLQAGLFPLLRTDHVLPIYVRLAVREQGGSLIEQVRDAMLAQLSIHHVQAPAFGEGESLWEWLHREHLELWSSRNNLVRPLFVLDQFEEVFTFGSENAEAVAQFRLDLADLCENRVPKELAESFGQSEERYKCLSLDTQRSRVLLSLREDFVPALEGWKREIPLLMRNRFRLLPMSVDQGVEAIHRTAPRIADEEVAREIANFVAAAQSDQLQAYGVAAAVTELEVEPALLSLVCEGLNQRRKALGMSRFDSALLKSTGQAIVSNYYQSVVKGVRDRLQRFIEQELITERGFRKQCDVHDAISVHHVTDAELKLLVYRRLLRIEPHKRTERVELTHDLLTGVVRKHRDRRRRRRQLAILIGTILSLLAVSFGLIGIYSKGRIADAEAAKNDADTKADAALREKEDAFRRLTRLIDEKTKQLEDLNSKLTAGTGQASGELRAVIASTRRELAATRTGIETDRFATLVRQFNDASADVRKRAVDRLLRESEKSPLAISLVLDTLADGNIDALSANGRINALFFLNRTKADGWPWSEEQNNMAQAAIKRMRARAAYGVVIGKQTGDELNRLERYLK